MTTLREARDQGKLEQFAKARDIAPPGDETRFNATLAAMARPSKAVLATSDEAPSVD